MKNRVLIVSNRLPVSVTEDLQLKVSSGGLVSALRGFFEPPIGNKNKNNNGSADYSNVQFLNQVDEFIWIGAHDDPLDDEKKVKIIKALGSSSIPVFIPPSIYKNYYQGYSNQILWPCLHSLPLSLECISHCDDFYQGYVEANKLFAEAVARVYQKGDLIWVQDFHLFLLPSLLRSELINLKKENENVSISFFLHTSFPPYEVFRILPQRINLINSLMESNLVGFHSYDYMTSFVNTVTRLIGATWRMDQLGNAVAIKHLSQGSDQVIRKATSKTRIVSKAIGIHPSLFDSNVIANSSHTEFNWSLFSNRNLVLGIDRVDEIKGLPHKLCAFMKFLNDYPQWHNKVVLVQIAVPSREGLESTKNVLDAAMSFVARINSTFGTLNWLPVIFLHKSVDFNTLCALYKRAQVCFISSLRDGMNLVAMEYVAVHGSLIANKSSQNEDHTNSSSALSMNQDSQESNSIVRTCGSLLVSVLAGVVFELGAGAFHFNPYSMNEASKGLNDSLEISQADAERRMAIMYSFVTLNTAQNWADSLLHIQHEYLVADSQLQSIPSPHFHSVTSQNLGQIRFLHAMNSDTNNKICIFGLDSSNLMWINSIDYFMDDRAKLDLSNTSTVPVLHEKIEKLFHKFIDLGIKLIISSQLSKEHLEFILINIHDVWIIAEHGAYVGRKKNKKSIEWTLASSHLRNDLNSPKSKSVIQAAKLILKRAQDSSPGSLFIEQETCFQLYIPESNQSDEGEKELSFSNLHANRLLSLLTGTIFSNTSVRIYSRTSYMPNSKDQMCVVIDVKLFEWNIASTLKQILPDILEDSESVSSWELSRMEKLENINLLVLLAGKFNGEEKQIFNSLTPFLADDSITQTIPSRASNRSSRRSNVLTNLSEDKPSNKDFSSFLFVSFSESTKYNPPLSGLTNNSSCEIYLKNYKDFVRFMNDFVFYVTENKFNRNNLKEVSIYEHESLGTQPLMDEIEDIIQEVREAYLNGQIFFFFDFDGTLAPIVENPHEAAMPEETKNILKLLSRHVHICFLTGRSWPLISKLIDEPPSDTRHPHWYGTSHGMYIRNRVNSNADDTDPIHQLEEEVFVSPGTINQLQEFSQKIEKAFNELGITGFIIENSIHSLSLHYRNLDPSKVILMERVIHENLENENNVKERINKLKMRKGLMLFEILPCDSNFTLTGNKGTALLRILSRQIAYSANRPIINQPVEEEPLLRKLLAFNFGDDTTDEDSFEMLNELEHLQSQKSVFQTATTQLPQTQLQPLPGLPSTEDKIKVSAALTYQAGVTVTRGHAGSQQTLEDKENEKKKLKEKEKSEKGLEPIKEFQEFKGYSVIILDEADFTYQNKNKSTNAKFRLTNPKQLYTFLVKIYDTIKRVHETAH